LKRLTIVNIDDEKYEILKEILKLREMNASDIFLPYIDYIIELFLKGEL